MNIKFAKRVVGFGAVLLLISVSVLMLNQKLARANHSETNNNSVLDEDGAYNFGNDTYKTEIIEDKATTGRGLNSFENWKPNFKSDYQYKASYQFVFSSETAVDKWKKLDIHNNNTDSTIWIAVIGRTNESTKPYLYNSHTNNFEEVMDDVAINKKVNGSPMEDDFSYWNPVKGGESKLFEIKNSVTKIEKNDIRALTFIVGMQPKNSTIPANANQVPWLKINDNFTVKESLIDSINYEWATAPKQQS
ncbi:MAG: hypothetical protein LBT37_02945 [Lactobacillaceae bacterium]|jgi:hypothetical protein|nr:hypothetical protein [Lactobacillaceae bacterium]